MSCIRCGKKTNMGRQTCAECKKNDYMRNYLREHRIKKPRYKVCRGCGTEKDVMPFIGYCWKCYKVFVKFQRRA